MPAAAKLAERLCATLEEQHARTVALLAPLPEATLDAKGVVGEWSIKNVLAHLSAWELVVIQALPDRIATGKTPEVLATISANEDAWNEAQVAESEELSPADQIAELAWTRSLLTQYICSLDEATLGKRKPWDGWDGTIAEYILSAIGSHEQEHYEAIRAALARQPQPGR
jgi:hypothetical protein